jgi:hypothetical protein
MLLHFDFAICDTSVQTLSQRIGPIRTVNTEQRFVFCSWGGVITTGSLKHLTKTFDGNVLFFKNLPFHWTTTIAQRTQQTLKR